MKIQVVFHSLYGHTYRLAQAIQAGAEDVGAEVKLTRVQETLPAEVLEKMGAVEAVKQFEQVPVAEVKDLAEADGIIFGTPTRFGMMSAQMKSFMDATGQLWMEGKLINKVGSVFTSTATQHGGQESTILNFHTVLLHHGMVLVGLPYSEQKLMDISEMAGGSPYGSSTITGGDGSRMPSELELEIAKSQGRHVAEVTKKMVG